MPAGQKNWLKNDVKKADGSKDYIILENPAAVKQLDDLLSLACTAYEAY
ncbi:MAG: hypothetical protein AABY87_13630 [bacterium]